MVYVDGSGRVTRLWLGDDTPSSLSLGVSTVVESAIPMAAAADNPAWKPGSSRSSRRVIRGIPKWSPWRA
jgi:hypothetical protein